MRKWLSTALLAGALAMASNAGSAAEYTMKMALGTGPLPDHYSHTPTLNFEKEVEEKSGGRIDVKLFWNNSLGKIENVLNLVRGGLVESGVGSDGHVAPYYPNVQVLGIPYLFIDRQVAYEVLDGPFGQHLAERMANEAGIRPLMWMENGGYRHYSSNKPMRTAADLEGLKIRTMTNPVHMQIVRSLGASPTPIAWADLYTSLQTGVVDGQENALSTFRIPKLEEVQKHIILDGHVYSITALFVSEKWLKTLPDDLVAVLETAAENMKTSNRAISQRNESRDRAYLEGEGVSIVDPSLVEKAKFQELTQQPAIEALKQEVDLELLNELMEAVKTAESKLKQPS